MKRVTIFVCSGLLAVVLSACESMQSMPLFGKGDWVTLLDGPNGLENWNRVGGANWAVVDGVVQADRNTQKGSGFLVTKNSYKDFVIRVEFWVSDNANSGIYMRCADANVLTDKSCYEANIFDQRPDPSYGTGAIVHIAKIANMPKAGGKWNVYEITARGPKLTVVLNGNRTVEAEDSKFAAGPIGLQWAAGTVKFRKVQIRPL